MKIPRKTDAQYAIWAGNLAPDKVAKLLKHRDKLWRVTIEARDVVELVQGQSALTQKMTRAIFDEPTK